MTRSKEVAHIVVVVAVLVSIAHEKTYRATRSLAFKHPRQYLDLVSLAPGRSESALPWASSRQLSLHEVEVHFNPGRHAINNATYSCSMALSKSCETKYIAVCVHRVYSYLKNMINRTLRRSRRSRHRRSCHRHSCHLRSRHNRRNRVV